MAVTEREGKPTKRVQQLLQLTSLSISRLPEGEGEIYMKCCHLLELKKCRYKCRKARQLEFTGKSSRERAAHRLSIGNVQRTPLHLQRGAMSTCIRGNYTTLGKNYLKGTPRTIGSHMARIVWVPMCQSGKKPCNI